MNKLTSYFSVLIITLQLVAVGTVQARGLVQKFEINGGPSGLNGYGYIIFPVYVANFGEGGHGSTSDRMPILDITVTSPPPPDGVGHIYHLRYRVCCEGNFARWKIKPQNRRGKLKHMELPEIELFGRWPGDEETAYFSMDYAHRRGQITTWESGNKLIGRLRVINE